MSLKYDKFLSKRELLRIHGEPFAESERRRPSLQGPTGPLADCPLSNAKCEKQTLKPAAD